MTTDKVIPFGQHAFGCLVAFGMTACLLVGPTAASPAPSLSELDLQLNPSDVALPKAARPPSSSENSDLHGQNVPEIVGEIDQVQRSETPQKRTPGTGPLENLSASQGMLKELLENKTIPLFRVSVPPPF